MSQNSFDELDQATEQYAEEQAASRLQEKIEYAIIKTVQSIDDKEFSGDVAEALGVEAGTKGQARELLNNIYHGQVDNPEPVENYVNSLLSAFGLEGQDQEVFEYASQRLFAGQYQMPESTPAPAQRNVETKLITNETIVEDVSTKVAEEMSITPEDVIEFIQERSVRDAMPEAQRDAITGSIVNAVQQDFSAILMVPDHLSQEGTERFVMTKMNAVINGIEKSPENEASSPAPDEPNVDVPVDPPENRAVMGQAM